MDRLPIAIAELLQCGDRLGQRRDREPGRRQLGHTEIDRQGHGLEYVAPAYMLS
ncbi:hypothetical protein [Nonomuraea recticatena]|uniref:hypothetical protein n=1 Tax=Nonomuraea recticatena TaxID=46178 RepID=UPI00360A61E3